MIKNKFDAFVIFLVFTNIFLVSIFTRSFLGVSIFGFRIGEIYVGFLAVFAFLVLLSKSYFYEFKSMNNLYFAVLIFTLGLFLSHKSNFSNVYIFKSSSFVWIISSLYLGYVFQKKYQVINYFKVFVVIPFILYVFNTGNYPNIFIDFFKKYSDKFQYTKGADIVLISVIAICIVIYFYNNLVIFRYILILSSLILPLLQYMSRAAFISYLLSAVIFLFYLKAWRYISRKKIIVTFLISLILFMGSYLRVAETDFSFLLSENNPETLVSDSIKKVNDNKDTTQVFLSFYFQGNRLMSKDPTTNWRLDIWQDLIEDMIEEKNIAYGYGFNEIIPVMTDPEAPGRLGRDGLNEHVHNHFFTILARGGIAYLFLFIVFYFNLLKILSNKVPKLIAVPFIVPIFLISLFDITMDGVQHPLLFFMFLGIFISDNKYKDIIKNYE